jgi:hypothetical protein
MNFHTWNQNHKNFKKRIKMVLIHKIKIQRATKKILKKSYHPQKSSYLYQVIVLFQL